MLLLDLRTIFFTNALISVLLAFIMVSFWRTQKTYPGFSLWVISYLIMVTINSLLWMRGHIPDYISMIGPLTLAVFISVTRLEGIKQFLGYKKFNYYNFLWPAFVFLGGTYLLVIHDSVEWRNLILAVALIVLGFRIVQLLITQTLTKDKSLFYLAASTIVIYMLVFGVRAILWMMDPNPHSIFEHTLSNYLCFLAMSILEISTSIIFIMLTSQRLAGELQAFQDKLSELASIDSLTGVYNRRNLYEFGELESDISRRYHHQLSVLMLDMDHFKIVNDQYGHSAGDMVLREISGVIQKALRHPDRMGRLGGEEFGIILPHTDLQEAKLLAERIRRLVESTPIAFEDQTINVTLSIGVAELSSSDKHLEDLIKSADGALYQAKTAGRNCVIALAR
jgi:diguanylate cyclase (GGDEF)-like protein